LRRSERVDDGEIASLAETSLSEARRRWSLTGRRPGNEVEDQDLVEYCLEGRLEEVSRVLLEGRLEVPLRPACS